MTRQDYIDFLVDHYDNPRSKGEIDKPDIHAVGGNPGCGDIISMFAHVEGVGAEARVKDISFDGHGCTISQAAASVVTEMLEGRTVEEIDSLTFDELIDTLGRDVVLNRMRCATLAIGTLKGAVHEYMMKERIGL